MTPNDPNNEPMIARDATYHRAPDTLRARVRGAVAAEARAYESRELRRWGGIAAALFAVAVISWNAALLESRGSHEDRVAEEIVTAHVRSLMLEGHLNDVASSDQHTVKPWFAGKLDFAPQVTDFASAGYPLAGGRLDYLDDRPVAALTYRRRLHVINVFEWPAHESRDVAPRTLTERGYSVVYWSRGGLQYWAVSDAAASEISGLVKLLSS